MLSSFLDQKCHSLLAEWFRSRYGEATDVQIRAWEAIDAGNNTLIAAPTGSGKTLAALLPCLNDIMEAKAPSKPGEAGDRSSKTRILYITPLKALNNDIYDHLTGYVEELDRLAKEKERDWPGIRSAVRTGDTPSSKRAAMLKRPPDVLVTTPESFYILLTSEKGRGMLRGVETVIVDEIHSLAADKRGSHLSLSLERLELLCGRKLRRIGVSATQKPLARVAAFLGGWEKATGISPALSQADGLDADGRTIGETADGSHPLGYARRPVRIVESRMDKQMNVRLTMPDHTMLQHTRESVWEPIMKRLFELMTGCRTVLLFVNSRRLCERLCLRLNDHAGYEMARAHHGSMAKEIRLEAERLLKAGELKCIVATSSLELGIDVGHVDLVIQLDSPLDAASGIQRVGRAGHGVGEPSEGVIMARARGVLPEAAVLAKLIAERDIEPIEIPRNRMDVLSQQTVSIVAAGELTVQELYELIVQSDSYRDFQRAKLEAMLRVLAGFYPFARPLLEWNRESGMLSARKNTGIAALTGAGTIPSSSSYPVHHADSRVHLGELDEEFVQESRVGDVFLLGTNSWMIRRIDKDRIYVAEAENRFSEVPFWRNEGPGRTFALGMQVGAFMRELDERLAGTESDDTENGSKVMDEAREGENTEGSKAANRGHGAKDEEAAAAINRTNGANLVSKPDGAAGSGAMAAKGRSGVAEWLTGTYRLDDYAAEQLLSLAESQRSSCGMPTDKRIIIEHYKDVMNQAHVIVHSPFGRKVNRTWLLALERQFETLLPYRLYGNAKDNGIEFVLPEWDPSWLQIISHVTPDNLEPLLREAVTGSPLLAVAFRHIAETSLLLSRSFTRTPLWQKRLRSEELLREALPYADRFPYLAEAVEECLHHYLDLPHLRKLLAAIQGGEIEVQVRETEFPSAMATQFLADYVNMRIYEGDGLDPAIQMQLMHVNKEMAGRLFGAESLRTAVPEEVLLAEEQRLNEAAGTLRNAEDVLKLLKRRGDLSKDEMIALGGAEAALWLEELAASGRAQLRDFAPKGESPENRWICADESDWYESFPAQSESVMFIAGRFAENRLSITEVDLCERYPRLTLHDARLAIELLLERGLIQQAPFAASPDERIWSGRHAAERMIRLSIREARKQAEPVQPIRWCAQIARRQHAMQGSQLKGEEGLLSVLEQLQGLFLPLSLWESVVFPSRLTDYRKEELDMLCSGGEVIWIGRKQPSEKEGKVAFFLSGSRTLYEPYLTEAQKNQPSHPELLQHLRTGGASFLTKLSREEGSAPTEVLGRLLELAWEGHVSNDQFAPLRLLTAKKGKDWAKTGSGQGRWYWTGTLAETNAAGGQGKGFSGEEGLASSPGREAEAGESPELHWIKHLLDTYGIVTKELTAEWTPFDWDRLLPVLRKLEEWGALIRGIFIEGSINMQFTTSEVMEAVRAPLPNAGDEGISLLSASDPANPYGLFIDWPAYAGYGFARKPGNYLVMQGGQWVYWLENYGRRVHTIRDNRNEERLPDVMELKAIFRSVLKQQQTTKLVIDKWDGEDAVTAAGGRLLKEIGAEPDRKSLVLWPSVLF